MNLLVWDGNEFPQPWAASKRQLLCFHPFDEVGNWFLANFLEWFWWGRTFYYFVPLIVPSSDDERYFGEKDMLMINPAMERSIFTAVLEWYYTLIWFNAFLIIKAKAIAIGSFLNWLCSGSRLVLHCFYIDVSTFVLYWCQIDIYCTFAWMFNKSCLFSKKKWARRILFFILCVETPNWTP